MRNLKIIFHYGSVKRELPVKGQKPVIIEVPTTTCEFRTKDKEIIASTTVILHKGDVNNKLVGRTFAFKKTVNILRDKNARRVMWTDFRTNMKQVS